MSMCGVCGQKFKCEHTGWDPEKGNFFVHHVESEDPNIIEIQHITYYDILKDGKGTFVQGDSETFIGYRIKPPVQRSIFDFAGTNCIPAQTHK